MPGVNLSYGRAARLRDGAVPSLPAEAVLPASEKGTKRHIP